MLTVNIASSYRMVMWLVGIFSLGIGALGLWLVSRKWPRTLDDGGVTLRNGKRFAWSELTKIIRVTAVNEHGGRMSGRVDLAFGKYRVPIVPQSLVEGPQVMQWLSKKLGQPITSG